VIATLDRRQGTIDNMLYNCRRWFPEFVALAETPFTDIIVQLMDPDPSARPEASTLLHSDVLKNVNSNFTDSDLKSIGAFEEIDRYRVANNIVAKLRLRENNVPTWLMWAMTKEERDETSLEVSDEEAEVSGFHYNKRNKDKQTDLYAIDETSMESSEGSLVAEPVSWISEKKVDVVPESWISEKKVDVVPDVPFLDGPRTVECHPECTFCVVS